MKFIILALVASILYCSRSTQGQTTQKRLVCYYNAIHPEKQGFPHYFGSNLVQALSSCTHLVYGYAQIWKSFEISKFRLHPHPNDLKSQFHHLKVYLSVGGDRPELAAQYLNFLEAGVAKQQHFIENVRSFLTLYQFDGLDLSLPLPHNKPRKVHTNLGQMWKHFKKMFTGDQIIDANATTHKQEYTEFVRNLRNELLEANLELSMTVLPNVNSTWYFDVFKIHNDFDFINLFAFDFLTPQRNPDEADYTSAITFKDGDNRLPHYNVEYQVNYWINNGCPPNKLNLGIATYGRAWKLTVDSGLSGVPVIENTNGPAEKGNLTQSAGLLSWPEICTKLDTPGVLHQVKDNYGNYAFWPSDSNGNNGIWVSYDDPEFAGIKTEYAKSRNLGGVALFDLHHDDYEKFCMGPAFPILTRISQGLGISHKYNSLASTQYRPRRLDLGIQHMKKIQPIYRHDPYRPRKLTYIHYSNL